MKFIAKILPLLIRPQFKFKMSYLWAGLTAAIILLLVLMLLTRFVFGKTDRISRALETGQRLEISIETGKIIGKIYKSEEVAKNSEAEKAVPEKTETEKTTEEVPPAAALPEENKTAEAEKEPENKKPAWLEEDYIGPRLPDGVIEALLGDDVIKTKLTVDSVSIKDLSKNPVVVIIIKGMGLSSSSTSEALELPKEITMGFSPYSPSLVEWVKKAKATGHEVVLNIPMETKDFHTDNPGPYSLLSQSTDEDNSTRLKMLLGLTKDYNAIYSDNNEIFTRSSTSIKPMLELLKKEGKYFIYGGGYANYAMIQIAESIDYPILVNDLVLDDDISANIINDRFKEAEKIAKDKGYVVIMAHPYPITIRMIKAWLPKAAENGLVIHPVSLLLGKVFKTD